MQLPRLSDILGPPTPRGRMICYNSGLALLCWMSFAITVAAYRHWWCVLAVEGAMIATLIYQLNKMKNYFNSNGGKW